MNRVAETKFPAGQLPGNFTLPSVASEAEQATPPQRCALPAEKHDHAKELDPSNSSDALPRNIFCFPGIARCRGLIKLFGENRGCTPEFGVPGKVPLNGGKTDTTEIDMQFGGSFVEAKLTEANFTAKSKTRVALYRDFEKVFEAAQLPQSADTYMNYQLVRNVLAAFAHGRDFVLVCDARRPDLLRSWWDVMRSIKLTEVRSRCHFVLWQELAAELPQRIVSFLAEKYGIFAL